MTNYLQINQSAKGSIIFLAMGITVFMVDIDITAVSTAMTRIAQELNLNLSTSQWVINGYLIAAAALMTIAGRLSDIYGTRRIFLIGITAFTASSLAVALAIDAYSICVGRFLQGACMAFIFPLSILITKSIFSSEQQGFVIGMLISIAGISQAIGPGLGGLMVHWMSWRMLFLINIPLGVIVIGIVSCFVRESHVKLATKKLDGLSVILFVGALMLLMYVINHVHNIYVSKSTIVLCLISASSMLVIFLWIDSQSNCPIIDRSLFRNHDFLILNGIRAVTQISYFGILFMMGMLLEDSFNINIFQVSAIMSTLTLTFGISSFFTGRFADKYGNWVPMILGLGLMLLGYLELALIGLSDGSLWMITSALGIIGVSSALLLPALTNSILMSVSQDQSGSAIGLYFSNGYFSASIGVGLSGVFINMINAQKSFIASFVQFMWLCSGLLVLTLIVLILCQSQLFRIVCKNHRSPTK